MVAEHVEPAIHEQIEIPFVPVLQRQLIRQNTDDTIIVVGQSHRRKRKRSKKQAVEASTEVNDRLLDEVNRTKSDSEEEPFDYGSVPNILDIDSKLNAANPSFKQRRRGM